MFFFFFQMTSRTCGDCEYFGKWQDIASVNPVVFDKIRGAHCDCKDNPMRERVRIYEHSEAETCRYFKPREWMRPTQCNRCNLVTGRTSDGSYLCSGYPYYKAKFAQAEAALRAAGYTVMNPAILPQGFEYEECMHICFAMIDCCDALYRLPDWYESPGARRELEYALQKQKAIFIEVNNA